MTRAEAITQAYFLATGKTVNSTSNIPPAKRTLLESLAIKYYRKWQTEPGMEWESLFSVVGAGTVTATDIFDLDEEIHFITQSTEGGMNGIRVLHADGINFTEFTTCTPRQLHRYREGNYVAKISDNRIQFSKPFIAENATFGGTIQVPAIIKLDDLTSDNDDILIDNPEWLPERMSAQYALSFKSLSVLYPDLLQQANDTLKSMRSANNTGNESSSTGVDYFASMGNVH